MDDLNKGFDSWFKSLNISVPIGVKSLMRQAYFMGMAKAFDDAKIMLQKYNRE